MSVALGVGCGRGASLETVQNAVLQALARAGLDPSAVSVLATIDKKRDEPAILALAARNGWPVAFFSAEALSGVPVKGLSETVRRHIGTPAVAEAAAMLAADTAPEDLLLVKQIYWGRDEKSATVAIARMRRSG